MKKCKLLFLLFIVIIMTVGCSNANKLNKDGKETEYYIIENGKKIYFESFKFIDDIHKFGSILNSTVKSLNEVKDGKRDLRFINEIESQELKEDEYHKIFSSLVPRESELRTINVQVESYKITGLQYDKDQNMIKVYLRVKTNEEQKDGLIKVENNQTYIYKLENGKLLLKKYDLSQYLR